MTARARGLGLAALALLAGAVTTAPACAQETVLRCMIHPPYFEAWPALLEVAEAFGRRHGVRVEILSSAGSSNESEKIKIHLTAGLPLDVTWIDIQEFGAYLREDALLDLQPWFDADAAAGRWDPAEYFDVPLRALTDGRGHLYGLPSTFTPYVMYANLDLLAEAGLDPPRPEWTWDEFLDIARKTTRDADGDGRTDHWGVSLTQWLQALVPWIWQNGGEVLDPATGRCVIDSPEAVEAVRWLSDLLHREKVAAFDATIETLVRQGLFQAGRVALYGPVGCWEIYRFKQIREFRWDVLPLPRGKRAATSIGMRSYVVPRGTKHPELAYRFVRELGAERMQRELARIGNGVPGLKSAAYSEDFLKPGPSPASERVFLDVLERGEARFLSPRSSWWRIEDLCQAELQGVLLLGRYPAAEACGRIRAKAEEFFRREEARERLPEMPRGSFLWTGVLAVPAAAVLFLLLRGRRPGRLRLREERAASGHLALWAAGFLGLTLGPMAVSALLSLSEWSPLRPLDGARFEAAGNYARLLADGTFHDSLRVTLLYALVSVPLDLAAGLGLALLVRRRSALSGVARTVFYLPTLVSPVIVGCVWRWVLDRDAGILNRGLAAAGIDGPGWLVSATWILPAFVLMSLWMTGAQMLVFLAAMQGLDPRLEEAARLDGAGRWARFRHVVLPQLTPVVLFNLVAGVIAAFQIFAQPFIMTQGGPGNASRFLVLHLYDTGFKALAMGEAAAMAWILFALLLVITLLILWSARRWVHYEGRA